MPDIPTTVKNRQLVEKRRKQIVLAAIKLFSQKGFHKTTLRDLAQEAGLSHGNIYSYVGSKEDIFYLIHKFLADLVMETINRSVEGITDPIEKLRRMVRAEFDNMNQWADGVLLIYQEGHVLHKSFLHRLLQKERAHMEKFELVIEECVKEGLLRDCNVRLSAHLIKSMIDSWVLKHWDLRGKASQIEAERLILDLTFKGLLKEKECLQGYQSEMVSLMRKTALVVNGGTALGTAIISFLHSKGAKLATHLDSLREKREFPTIAPEESKAIKFYSTKKYGRMTADLFKQIVEDFGPIDIYIHDLGIGNLEITTSAKNSNNAGRRLETNLACAQNIAVSLKEKMANRLPERIIYLAPWAWDRYADPIHYETVKAGTIALTQIMAKALGPLRTSANCIIPGFIKAIRPSKIQKQMVEELESEIPYGILGEISDVTDAISFLAGDSSRYVTGQTLKITGGLD